MAIGMETMPTSDVVRDLRVMLDSELSLCLGEV